MLQDFIIGKNALPLVAGVITMYQDSNQTILKNWYYQTGTPGNYTYAALPNPMTLSAAGTMIDVNGNDIIPFYYPWSETDADIPQPYFVTVYDQYGTLQFTRNNFPFVSTDVTPIFADVPSLENYIINNRFWRNANIASESGNGTLPNSWTTQYNSTGTVYYQTLAPDQHDGFSMPDFNYIKNVNGSANETISFLTFPKQQVPLLVGDIQPEFYINHNCVADTSGAALKAYQFPISLHLATLSCQQFTFTIQGQAVSGSSTVGIYIYTFCGTGVASPAPTLLGNITFTTTWTKWTLTGTFPSTLGLTLGSDGAGGDDDAYYLQINMPNGGSAVCNLNFAVPSLYLSNDIEIPTNSFSTYDQIDSVVSSPRTGDVRMSVNTFQPFGWVPMNDGTLAIANSGTTTIVAPTNSAIAYQGYDAWALYNLLWSTFSAYSINSTLLLPIYTSAGALTTYGASAFADWQAFKQIKLTQMMGKVILGTAPVPTLTNAYSTTFTGSNSGGNLLITAANNLSVFNGMPFYFTGTAPGGLALNTIYYVTAFNGTTAFNVSLTFALAMAGTKVAFSSTGGSGSIVIAFTGTYEGEYAHMQLNAEVGSHLHPPLSPATSFLEGSSGGSGLSGAGTFLATATTGLNQAAGVVVAANVTQPASFYNAYIKL